MLKLKFRIFNALMLLIVSSNAISQNDWFINKQSDTIKCNVVNFKINSIDYKVDNNKNVININFNKINDLHINDLSIFENPQNIKVEEPESGFANVYFYRTYKYTGSALPCKVIYNGKPLINIKTNSYHVQKIKAGEIHKYNWVRNKKNVIEIKAKEGESYFIRGGFGVKNGIGKVVNLSNSMNIAKVNANIAKYSILKMTKKSKVY